MPATLREKVSRGEEAYCGHCLGDGCDWEEEQERKRARRDAIRSLERGEYVHPSHYMDVCTRQQGRFRPLRTS